MTKAQHIKRIRSLILKLVQPIVGHRLLDLGCGDGAFTQELQKFTGASDVYGIEINPSLATAAKKKRGIIVSRSNLDAPWPYPDDYFDAVIANQIIEHVCDTDHFLLELRRVLKPSGFAIISTQNLAGTGNLASLVLGYQPLSAFVSDVIYIGNPFNPQNGHERNARYPGHRRIFTRPALHQLLRCYGFLIEASKVCGWYPFRDPFCRVLERVLPRYGSTLIVKVRRHAHTRFLNRLKVARAENINLYYLKK